MEKIAAIGENTIKEKNRVSLIGTRFFFVFTGRIRIFWRSFLYLFCAIFVDRLEITAAVILETDRCSCTFQMATPVFLEFTCLVAPYQIHLLTSTAFVGISFFEKVSNIQKLHPYNANSNCNNKTDDVFGVMM